MELNRFHQVQKIYGSEGGSNSGLVHQTSPKFVIPISIVQSEIKGVSWSSSLGEGVLENSMWTNSKFQVFTRFLGVAIKGFKEEIKVLL